MRRLIFTFLVTAVATIAAPPALVTAGWNFSGQQDLDFARSATISEWLRYGPEISPDVVDGEVQDMETTESIMDEIGDSRVIASNRTGDRDVAPVRRGLWSLLRSPFAIVHAETQETASPLRMLVTSLGVSTGEAFSVQFLNQGPTPITLPRGGLTLRPLKREAAERAMSEFKQLTGRLTTVKMDGYCLNYQKLAPRAGVVYAVAPRAMQERNVSVREVLRLVTVLNAYGLITPEGDRRTYLHLIRQWALWTREQKFTERSFTSAMLDHAKKNLADTKRRWTSDDEKFVRAYAAKRWADVNTVLRVADKFADVRKGQ